MPHELSVGLARGQILKGRVFMLEKSTARTADMVSMHLVCETGSSGALFIEAWRDQARRLLNVVSEGRIVQFSNLTLKTLGDKAQWQCTDLDVYGHFLSTCKVECVEDDAFECHRMHTVLLRHLPVHAKIPHLIHVAGILMEIVIPTSTKSTAPAMNLVLGDTDQSVKVAVWQNHGANFKTAGLTGKAVVVTGLRVMQGKQDTTDLGTTRASRISEAQGDLAADLINRTKSKTEVVSMSTSYVASDYRTASTTKVHLSALTSLIVPDQMRDFTGEVYEVFHCLLEDVAPLPDADTIYYLACPICKKKTCQHDKDPTPNFLADCHIATFEGRAQVRAIGNVLKDVLGIEAALCVANEDGFSRELATALEASRSTPFNMKIIVGNPASSNRNVLELVHAQATINCETGVSVYPSNSWRLINGDSCGLMPCRIRSLEFQNHYAMLSGRPVTGIQILVTVTDTGEETGCMEKDNSLVRLKREGVCSLSGSRVVLHRTGELSTMSKYLKWNQGDILYIVGRFLSSRDDITHILIKASKRFAVPEHGHIFHTYFNEYCELTGSITERERLAMENSWTPKRRRQAIADDGDSVSEFTPKTFEATPTKFNTP